MTVNVPLVTKVQLELKIPFGKGAHNYTKTGAHKVRPLWEENKNLQRKPASLKD